MTDPESPAGPAATPAPEAAPSATPTNATTWAVLVFVSLGADGQAGAERVVALVDYFQPSSGATYFRMLSMTCAL